MAFVSTVPLSIRRSAPSLSSARPPRISASPSAAPIATRRSARPSTTMTATPSSAAAFLPPRVVLSPLPRLFVYDHCPFCVRARHALGLKNVKHEVIWLMNDDFATPEGLIGKKMVPILQPDGAAGKCVPESLDIVKLVDTDPRFGPPGLLRPASGRADIPGLLDDVADPLRRLTRVRFAMMKSLPEFVFKDGRDMYIQRHPLSDPASYEENFARSPQYVEAVQARLDELAAMIHSEKFITEGGLSYDDILFFPRLRSLTCVKDLVLPKKIRDYIEFHSEQAEIPLYDSIAL